VPVAVSDICGLWSPSISTKEPAGSQFSAAANVRRHAMALLDLDGDDERAHELLVASLTAAGRHGEAQRAIEHDESVMREMGLIPSDLTRT
jgi:DNA-binding SARP family transcriptional activator